MNEYEEIRKDPYKYVLDWMEMNLIVVGRNLMKIPALMPMSLLLPKIPFGTSNIRANISNLLIAEPSAGKSTLIKKLELLCIHPLVRRKISDNDLIKEADELEWMSILIEDLSQCAMDSYEVIKVLEGIIEEGKINKSTMRTKYVKDVKGIALLGVTPLDLEKFSGELDSGLLSRTAITFIKLTEEQRREIDRFVTLGAGDTQHSLKTAKVESTVVEFYKELEMIQRGKHQEYLKDKFGENHDKKVIFAVGGYEIDLKFKEELSSRWSAISQNLSKQGHRPSIRDLQEYFRFLVSSAFLNIHNRKCENGILVPNESDHKLALDLAINNMRLKWAIPLALKINRKTNNLEDLEMYLNGGVAPIIRDVLMATSKFGTVIKDNSQQQLQSKSNFTIK